VAGVHVFSMFYDYYVEEYDDKYHKLYNYSFFALLKIPSSSNDKGLSMLVGC
jgi:hypothetical protein